MTYHYLTRSDKSAVQQLEKAVRNKWSWAWMEKKLSINISATLPKSNWTNGPVDVSLGDFIKKVQYCNIIFQLKLRVKQ